MEDRPDLPNSRLAQHEGRGNSQEIGELLTACAHPQPLTHMHVRQQSRELKAKGQAHPSLPLCPTQPVCFINAPRGDHLFLECCFDFLKITFCKCEKIYIHTYIYIIKMSFEPFKVHCSLALNTTVQWQMLPQYIPRSSSS